MKKLVITLIFLLLVSILATVLVVGRRQNNSQKDFTSPIEVENPAYTGQCGIENCHGLDIVCGDNVPEACTEIYAIGDFCRQFASCEISGDSCQLAESKEFSKCKGCIEECIEYDDPTRVESCELKCRSLFEK